MKSETSLSSHVLNKKSEETQNSRDIISSSHLYEMAVLLQPNQ